MRLVLTVGASLVAKALGFVRVQQIANTLGVSYYADVLLVCFQLVWLIETVLISNAVVPIFVARIYQINNEAGAVAAARLFLHASLWCGIIATGFGLALFLGADWISAFLMPGLDDEAKSLFRVLVLASLVTPLALASAHFLSLVNRLTDNGVWYSVPQIVTNIVALIGLVVGYRLGGAFEAAVGMMLGLLVGAGLVSIMQLLVIPRQSWRAIVQGAKTHSHKILRLPDARSYWSGVGVLLIAALVQEAYIYIDFYFASSVGEGSVGLVSYSSRLAMLANMLVVASAFVILEPMWARGLAEQPNRAWRSVITPDALTLLCLLASPVAILMFYGDEFTQLIYRSDRFSPADEAMLNQLTQIYSLMVFAIGFSLMTARLLILLNRQRAVVQVNLANLPVKLGLSFWLVGAYGLPGLAVSTVTVLFLQGGCNMFLLTRFGGMAPGVWAFLQLIAGFGAVLALAAWMVPYASSGLLGLVLACAVVGLANIALAAVLRYAYFRAHRP